MKLKSRNRVTPEFSMASITDVIFLLLTFFMLTATASQSALGINLPKANGSEMPTERIYIVLNKDGKYFINKKPLQKKDIEIYLKNIFKNNPKPSFVIAADSESLHKDVVFLIDIASRNKYKVLIAAHSGKDEGK